MKSERQARTETARAVFERDSLFKLAEQAKHKVSANSTDAGQLEVEVSRLAQDIQEAERAGDKPADTHSPLKLNPKDVNLLTEGRAVSLRVRIEGLVEKQKKLGAEATATREREDGLKKEVDDLQAAIKVSEDELIEARLSAERNAVAASNAHTLETLSNQLGSELDDCKKSLQAGDDGNKKLLKVVVSLRKEGVQLADRTKILGSELGEAKAALERTAKSVRLDEHKLVQIDARRERLSESLESAEGKLVASYSDKTELERALSCEKTNCESLCQELKSTREDLETSNTRVNSLNGLKAASESKVEKMKQEVEYQETQFASAKENAKKLEESMAESVDEIASLQNRLGDALIESVKYADQAILSEEILRISEADRSSLRVEQEELKKELNGASVQNHDLQRKIVKSSAEVKKMQRELELAEARWVSSIEDGDKLEEELDAAHDELARLERDLVKARDQHATTSSIARVLKASCDDKKVEVVSLEKELARVESCLDESAEEAGRLRADLALSLKQKGEVKQELSEAIAQVNTKTTDFVALEAKLRDAEADREKLKSLLETTEADLAKATANAIEEQKGFDDVLARVTCLQEDLAGANERLAVVVSERQYLEERLHESLENASELENALSEAKYAPPGVVAAQKKLDDQLKKSQLQNIHLQQHLTATEKSAGALRDSLAEALEGCGNAVSKAVQLELKVQTSAAERDSALDQANEEVEKLKAVVAEKDVRLEKADKQTSDFEAEGARLLEVLDEFEASYVVGHETNAGMEQELADVRGIGLHLEKRLTTVVDEWTKVQGRYEVAQVALAASLAHRRRIALDLEVKELVVETLTQNNEACRRDLENMEEVFYI